MTGGRYERVDGGPGEELPFIEARRTLLRLVLLTHNHIWHSLRKLPGTVPRKKYQKTEIAH